MRLLLYSHDGVGLGHVRRHLAIAFALSEAAPHTQILLANGVDETALLGLPPRVDTLKLPALRKMGNDQYAGRRLNLPMSEIRAMRSSLLLAAVRSFRPAVVLVDKHPLGVGGEFREGLQAARDSGARLVLGLRDILDDPATVLGEWMPERMHDWIQELYDLILIYGSASVFDPVAEYQFPFGLRQRTRYCGYVVNSGPQSWFIQQGCEALGPEPCERPMVLATTGGGEDGFDLLKVFIESSTGAPWKSMAVAGPMLAPSQLNRLKNLAAEHGVRFHTFLPGLAHWLGSVDALVSMGGYNTLVEAMRQAVPTTCVPRAHPRSEQMLRAQAFEQLGLLQTLHPEQLTVPSLRSKISAMLQMSRPKLRALANELLSFDGAGQAAHFLLHLARSVRRNEQGELVAVGSREKG
jgi:predicted glycosyltransferase